ncbi:hypothetical protein ACR2SE_28710 (plasmid) [Citrobacter freundii]|uniref:hypothetical protein n=1 Tax=Citrobacter freundii TaxID=546 RepID=UPI003DA1BF35
MTTFTKEQLIEQARKNIEVLEGAVTRLPGNSEIARIHLRLAEITLAALTVEPLMWVNEDSLPANYPYDELFPFSKVNIVRMFPVYGPQLQEDK